MTAVFQENAISAQTPQNDLPSHLVACGGKNEKYDSAFHQKRRQEGDCYGKDKGAVQSTIYPKRL